MKNRIKLVVVGLRFGEYIVECQLNGAPGEDYIELLGVFDLDESKTKRIAHKHYIRQYTSLEEVLGDSNVEAIGLFTPPLGRAELIRQIIHAGKHVITTKPFELDAEATFTILEEARALGKIVHINAPSPLPDAETAQIQEWQQTFELGEPVAARWETYTQHCEVSDGSWYDDPEQCPVAPVFRLGIYGISQLVRLCGKVRAVSVVHSRIMTGRPTPDNAELSLLFESGALGSIFASFCIDDGQRYSNNLCIHFTRGTVWGEVSKTAQNHNMLSKRLHLHALDSDDQVLTRSVELTTEQLTGKYQWKNFRDAVRNENPLDGEIDPLMVAHSVQVINAMSEAERKKMQVVIPALRAHKPIRPLLNGMMMQS
jgi:predicted dehydrogenase